MIVSDLDGTLFNSDQPGYEVSRELIKSIRLFRESGRIFTIATGRPQSSCTSVVNQLDLDVPYIACNGALITDRTGKRYYSHSFSLDNWLPFLEKVRELGAAVLITHLDKVYYLQMTEAVRRYENKEGIQCHPAGDWLIQGDNPVSKVLLIGNVSALKIEWENLNPSIKNFCRYVISEHNYMEVIGSEISKGAALKLLKKHLGIRDDEVVCIGNQMNDLELLEEAHIGVAVANAEAELKTMADYITAGEFDRGVLEVINKYR
ncbi:HAD family hydrolase [Desulfosporosinus shakirovi]|uniref:HAD family hydrolase n=1 Tax=Desulfosporosinus shakirovi TaxID=2885154 RepID=UPI001E45F36B|nr:HAD family hydrolase [Desulfosporosinus sp. SRJS8]MCB8814784.1 HAD family hydrolase [Desulfosporosinus sp. SRJS8]